METISVTIKSGILEGKLTTSPKTGRPRYCFMNKFYIGFNECATLSNENDKEFVKVSWGIEHNISSIYDLRASFSIPLEIYKDKQKCVEFAARECMNALFDFYNNFFNR